MKSLEGLTHADKDSIIRKSIEVCKWQRSLADMLSEMGIRTSPVILSKAVELRDLIEATMEMKIEELGA